MLHHTSFAALVKKNILTDLSNNTIDSLINKASQVDFAVFIFSPDDLILKRNKETKVVRDNVIFELGLFIGTIGKARCYIVKPRNVELHFPTDLLGLTTTDYESNRSDGDLSSALNLACSLIKKEISKLGLLDIKSLGAKETTVKESVMTFTDVDFRVLAKLLSTHTSFSGGFRLWDIKRELDIQESFVDLSSIKLESMGFVQKRNSSENDGYEYYSYTITQDGINYLLQNEEKLHSISRISKNKNGRLVDNGDDLPF
ncbi:TIR domain-containing protein [Chitinophaga flava]|uniref:CD-NTase-associated protein 12/Pycsar effector protein TIR domain-containing protein n=1 Tax=Chitinophaga flava TaxID=2259036 RepID=A0A365XQM2_9BACT|nr:TIR domain-containing protein [Chitinophaga flava]RBL88642.1 hypothetical protein DF182_18915 [Chitinophaga flava]